VDFPHQPTFRLVVGLGNPGGDYVETRHNVGFMIVDRLSRQESAPLRREKKWNAEIALAGKVMLCKPLSFMNLSGGPVSALSRFYKIEPAEVLVVLDDVALPLGKLRLRKDGSAGGHNGLQSILEQLGTRDVARLRIGIGAASERTLTGHVLGRFSPEERETLEASLNTALQAVNYAQSNGLDAAMNQFN
jgi:PTH1 family peptidyl-tRNA hydrolase